ncbi:MAG: HNH endonuclease signature motif containing protein [Methylophilaceae bacterium]
MTKSRNILTKRKQWSADEDALLQALYPCTKTEALARLFNCRLNQVYTRARALKTEKSQWFQDSPMSQILRTNTDIGKEYRFKKGQPNQNKGNKNFRIANSEKTRFKKGQVPPNVKPMYFERQDKNGYVWMKVPEKNPHTGAPTRFEFKHKWNWKQANGPIPDGMVIKFIDGNKQNCDLSNLELIPKAVNLALNQAGYDNMHEEIKPAFKTLAKLNYKQRQLQKA